MLTTTTRSRGARAVLASAALLGTLLAGASPAASAAPAAGPAGLAADFASAAHEFGVPERILLAVSYNLTDWQPDGVPTATGGLGPMGLIGSDTTVAVVGQATGLLHTTASAVLTDPAQNIRAAAAVLAADARATGGSVPADEAAWYPALVRYAQDSAPAGSTSAAGNRAFASDVFSTLHAGVPARQGSAHSGSTLSLAANKSLAVPATTKAVKSAKSTSDTPAPDCPVELDCRFVPAGYDWSSTNHTDPNNYGNYDPANRPTDGDAIQYIVIHDTESSYDSAIAAFQNPAHQASANYVIRSTDGQVTQMVPNQDVTWDVANWTMNQHSISIEHEGYAAQGATWYTPQQYLASARLVRYLAAEYHIPLDRQHIIAHEDVSGELTRSQARQHWDPGPFWNWQEYLGLVGAPIVPTGSPLGSVVTINPNFEVNQPTATTCDSTGTCTPLPAQGANFVYLRTGPSTDSPLLGDPLLHPGGGPGTTQASDWSDKAVTGHQYVVAAQQGEWTAIWFDGQQAWFDNPGWMNTLPASATTVRAPAGTSVVNLYGRAFPQQSEYPAAIPFDPGWTPTPLTGWTLPAGQSYTVVGTEQASNYYARFDGAGVAGNHTMVTGADQYLMIDYNHRYVYVQASDVQQVS